MSRNTLYLLLGALAVAVAFLAYNYYQESQTNGVAIEFGEGGVSVESD